MAYKPSISGLDLQGTIDSLRESLRQELQQQHVEIQNDLKKKIEELTKEVKEMIIHKQSLHGLSGKEEKSRLR